MMVSLLVLPVVRVRVSLKLLQLPRALHSTNRELLQCNTRKLEFLSASMTFSFFGRSRRPAPSAPGPFYQYALPTPSLTLLSSELRLPPSCTIATGFSLTASLI